MQTLRWWLVLHPPLDTQCPPGWAVGPSPCPQPPGRGKLKHPNLPNTLHVAFTQPHLVSANAHSWAGPQDPNLAVRASSEPKMSTAEATTQAVVRTTMKGPRTRAQSPCINAWWHHHNRAASSVLTNQLQSATYPTPTSLSLAFLAL